MTGSAASSGSRVGLRRSRQQRRHSGSSAFETEGRGRPGASAVESCTAISSRHVRGSSSDVGEEQVARLVEIHRPLDEVRDGGHDLARPAPAAR